jgi:broad-specificity NMP kinase
LPQRHRDPTGAPVIRRRDKQVAGVQITRGDHVPTVPCCLWGECLFPILVGGVPRASRNLSTSTCAMERIRGHGLCHRTRPSGAQGASPGSGGKLVRGAVFPVLWLCGPPGVGKTTVAWKMYSHLMQARIESGFVDIDQLGICYPEPAGDPGRHRMKARNIDAVVAGFRAACARCLIASGVVDPACGVHVDLIPQAAVTVCRLRADREVLRQRFTGRGGPAALVDEVLREADALDASTFADACVDTSGLLEAPWASDGSGSSAQCREAGQQPYGRRQDGGSEPQVQGTTENSQNPRRPSPSVGETLGDGRRGRGAGVSRGAMKSPRRCQPRCTASGSGGGRPGWSAVVTVVEPAAGLVDGGRPIGAGELKAGEWTAGRPPSGL